MADPERSREALLECIRSFKRSDISDLDAALNVIMNHAATIQRLHKVLREIADMDAGRASRAASMAIAAEVRRG